MGCRINYREIIKYVVMSDDESKAYHNQQHATKVVLREKVRALMLMSVGK